MGRVKVTIMDNRPHGVTTVELRRLLRKVCSASLKQQRFERGAEVNISLVNDEQIREINRMHRNIDASTDVLSFPLGENGEYDLNPETKLLQLGDIVISLERAANQAEEYGHSFEREAGYLTAHSMLHLLGYDHVNGGEQAAQMRLHEEAIMSMLGLER